MNSAAFPAPVLQVSALTFEYPGKRALTDVNFTLEPGAVLALVGPNGAGKTTLMRSIAGLDDPMAGSIMLDGVDVIAEPREAYRKLGYLSDFFGLYSALTVRQSLLHAAGMRALDEATQREAVARTAERLGLTSRLDARTDTLSRGWRQRVAIGQAMVHSPQVLLLDEPAAGLDPEARIGLSALFRQLRAEGMTLIVSSHILAELDEYSSHMLAIKDGRAVEFRRIEATVETGVTLRIVLAQAPENAEALLALLAANGISAAHTVPAAALGWSVQGNFRGPADAQAGLLKTLVGAGFPVVEFSAVRENLHDSYLRSMQSGAAASVAAMTSAVVSSLTVAQPSAPPDRGMH